MPEISRTGFNNQRKERVMIMQVIVEVQKETGIFHIEELTSSVNTNLKMLLETGDVNGYVPVAITDSWVEANLIANKIRERLCVGGTRIGEI